MKQICKFLLDVLYLRHTLVSQVKLEVLKLFFPSTKCVVTTSSPDGSCLIKRNVKK
jgi:hypothetical protein